MSSPDNVITVQKTAGQWVRTRKIATPFVSPPFTWQNPLTLPDWLASDVYRGSCESRLVDRLFAHHQSRPISDFTGTLITMGIVSATEQLHFNAETPWGFVRSGSACMGAVATEPEASIFLSFLAMDADISNYREFVPLFARIATSDVVLGPEHGHSAQEGSYAAFVRKLTEFAHAQGSQKRVLREKLAQAISAEYQPDTYLHLALTLLSSSAEPSRLDDAIDLLCELDNDLESFVIEELKYSPPNGSNDDYWYVLVRALGKSNKAAVVRALVNSPFRVVREAVVEALGDLADQFSIATLKQIAQTDKSVFIRELAEEIASELAA